MRVYDYKLTDMDLTIVNGDFAKDESTTQHMNLIVMLEKGELKQHPMFGVGIRSFLLDDRPLTEFESEACAQLEQDGLNIESFEAKNWDDVNIEAQYEG